MADRFETFEFRWIAKHDGRQLGPVNHGVTGIVCYQNVVAEELNHIVERSATRLDDLSAYLVYIDDQSVVFGEQ
tara:strand:- start:152 stop:373 length:222 start_codon:yes stop_codon:yes gene_type:complete